MTPSHCSTTALIQTVEDITKALLLSRAGSPRKGEACGSARRADGEEPGLRFEADSGSKLSGERAPQQI